MGSFSTALSAMRAASEAVQAVGHNLANLNTAGFKKAEISFQEIVAASTQTGLGVTADANARGFQQGAIQVTNRPLDAAIQGAGFFLVRPATAGATSGGAQTLLTRDGRFFVGADGSIMTAGGARVQGWRLDTSTNAVNPSGPVQDLLAPLGTTLPAKPTTRVSIAANLDASAAPGATLKIPLDVYDAQGVSHPVTVTFAKQSPNTWSVGLESPDPAVVQPLPQVSPVSLTFTNGLLDPSTPGALSVGAIALKNNAGQLGPLTLSLDPASFTQYSQPSALLSVTQDGAPPATLSDVRIGDGGKLIAVYSTGAESEIGRLALVSVRNPESLVAVSDNYYQPGGDTFLLPPAIAGYQSCGNIIGGALEGSNADLADQFTQLLTYQRGYQAGARAITANDELMQEALSLLR